jgi:two-component system, NarL family, sensor kinase
MENGIIVYYFVASTVVLLLVIAIVTYAFLHQKKVVQLKVQLHEEEFRRQQAIFDALQDGQEKERTRLAQELHDGVGAKLSGLKMNLEYLDINATEYKELISKIFMGVTETLEEVREVSHNLLPYQLNGKEMRELLLNCIEQFNNYDDCSYDLFMDDVATKVNETVKIHVYRMITELLNNIHKHAKATIASIQISIEEEKMEIVVEDNGIGLERDASKPEGIGLMNIKNRISICKGSINIDSSGKGTSIIIEIPLNTKL